MRLAICDKEFSAESPVEEEAQVVAPMVAKLSHSCYHNALLTHLTYSDSFNLVLKLFSREP